MANYNSSYPGNEANRSILFALRSSSFATNLGLQFHQGLFLAGQINGRHRSASYPLFVFMLPLGTTGYEEAAAQGIVAGINAGLAALQRPPFIVTRADGFLGVMIDDLIVKGVEEPCTFLSAVVESTLAQPCI